MVLTLVVPPVSGSFGAESGRNTANAQDIIQKLGHNGASCSSSLTPFLDLLIKKTKPYGGTAWSQHTYRVLAGNQDEGTFPAATVRPI